MSTHPNLALAEAMNAIQLAEEALSTTDADKYQWHIEKLVAAHASIRFVASQIARHWQKSAQPLTGDIEIPRTKPRTNWKAYE